MSRSLARPETPVGGASFRGRARSARLPPRRVSAPTDHRELSRRSLPGHLPRASHVHPLPPIRFPPVPPLRPAPARPRSYRLRALDDAGVTDTSRLPYSLRMMLEALLRTCDGYEVTEDDVRNLAAWNAAAGRAGDPLQAGPGGAAGLHRRAVRGRPGGDAGGDAAARRRSAKINPLVPGRPGDRPLGAGRHFGSPDALAKNVELEFARNAERYAFLRWGQQAFRQLPRGAAGDRHRPPGEPRIPGQVRVPSRAGRRAGGKRCAVAVPDTLVGTDSHTTMINGLGVVGWGVGGIEAEAVMLGQPLYMLLPEVVGFELTGELPAGATATDLVLTVTEMLREEGVVGKFVEFFGAGLAEHDRWPTGPRSPTWRPSTGPRWASSRSTTRRSPTCG